MRYLKKFENYLKYTNKEYWAIDLRDEYITRKKLQKINCNEDFIEAVIWEGNQNPDIGDIFVASYISIDNSERYYMYDFNGFKSQDFKFMGDVRLTSEEVKEIELQKNIDNFNI